MNTFWKQIAVTLTSVGRGEIQPLLSLVEQHIQMTRPKLWQAILVDRRGPTPDTKRALLIELRNESIRHNTIVDSRQGFYNLVYTDMNAYGMPLDVAQAISSRLACQISNTHGNSFLAGMSTQYLHQAVDGVFAHFGARRYVYETSGLEARRSYDILARGAGMTAAFDGYLDYLDRHIREAFLAEGDDIAVGFSAYEHHSASLPFQDWTTKPVQFGLTRQGDLDVNALGSFLEDAARDGKKAIVLSLSMQSNVTSVKTNIDAVRDTVVSFLEKHPTYKDRLFLSLDLAAYAPHADLDLGALHRDRDGTPLVDAIMFSPYKIDGGQQGAGIALVRAHITGDRPVVKGGGSVDYVRDARAEGTQYAKTERYDLHNAGSPNVMGLINTYLGLYFLDLLGTPFVREVEQAYTENAYAALNGFTNADGNVRISILGPKDLKLRGNTLPIIVGFKSGDQWHQVPPPLVGQMLEDFTGVVTRSGCNCAGPYAVQLFQHLREGDGAEKIVEFLYGSSTCATRMMARPGWTRATLSPLLNSEEVDYFIGAWQWLANHLETVMSRYRFDGTQYHLQAPHRFVDQLEVPISNTPSQLDSMYLFAPGKVPNLLPTLRSVLNSGVVRDTGDRTLRGQITQTASAYRSHSSRSLV